MFLKHKKKQINANEDSQKDLLSITAHELWNPLQTMLGSLEMTLDDSCYNDFHHEVWDIYPGYTRMHVDFSTWPKCSL